MRHLALILSDDLDRLADIQQAVHKAGFSANCASEVAVARSLVARYADDYHVVVVDGKMLKDDLKGFVRGVRGNAPKSRVLILLEESMKYEAGDPFVTAVEYSQALDLLPRLKREVTRYRSSPVNKSEAG